MAHYLCDLIKLIILNVSVLNANRLEETLDEISTDKFSEFHFDIQAISGFTKSLNIIDASNQTENLASEYKGSDFTEFLIKYIDQRVKIDKVLYKPNFEAGCEAGKKCLNLKTRTIDITRRMFFMVYDSFTTLNISLLNDRFGLFKNSSKSIFIMIVLQEEFQNQLCTSLGIKEELKKTTAVIFSKAWTMYQILDIFVLLPKFCAAFNAMKFDPMEMCETEYCSERVFYINKGDYSNSKRILGHLNSNFRKYPLRINVFYRTPTFVSSLPASLLDTYLRKDVENVGNVGGLDGFLLGNLVKYLNVQPVIEQSADGGEYGSVMPNGSFSGSLGDILLRRDDISLNGRFVRLYGTEEIEFTYPVSSDQFCLVAPKAERIPNWITIFQVFSVSTWYLILGTAVLMSTMWWAMLRLVDPLPQETPFNQNDLPTVLSEPPKFIISKSISKDDWPMSKTIKIPDMLKDRSNVRHTSEMPKLYPKHYSLKKDFIPSKHILNLSKICYAPIVLGNSNDKVHGKLKNTVKKTNIIHKISNLLVPSGKVKELNESEIVIGISKPVVSKALKFKKKALNSSKIAKIRLLSAIKEVRTPIYNDVNNKNITESSSSMKASEVDEVDGKDNEGVENSALDASNTAVKLFINKVSSTQSGDQATAMFIANDNRSFNVLRKDDKLFKTKAIGGKSDLEGSRKDILLGGNKTFRTNTKMIHPKANLVVDKVKVMTDRSVIQSSDTSDLLGDDENNSGIRNAKDRIADVVLKNYSNITENSGAHVTRPLIVNSGDKTLAGSSALDVSRTAVMVGVDKHVSDEPGRFVVLARWACLDVLLLIISRPMPPPLPRCHGQRIFLAVCLFFNLMIVGVFQGYITTAYSTTTYFKDISTLKLAEQSGMLIASSPSVGDLFGTDLSPTVAKLKKRIINVPSPALASVLTRHIMAAERRTDAKLFIELNFTSKAGEPKLHVVQECPRWFYLSYIVHKRFPFLSHINRFLLRANSAGLTKKWYDISEYSIVLNHRMKHKITERGLKKLTLVDVQTAFFFLFVGCAVSFLVLLSEMMIFYGRRRRMREIIDREETHRETRSEKEFQFIL